MPLLFWLPYIIFSGMFATTTKPDAITAPTQDTGT